MKFKSIPFYITHPKMAIERLRLKLSDRYGLEQQWKSKMDYPLNLDNPKGFNEKLSWLKLYDHNMEYAVMADKYRAKEWVAQKIGAKYIIPTYAAYGTAEEINLDELPETFVLKCNHDSRGAILCKDKSEFDIEEAKSELTYHLQKNYYSYEYEWAYKYIKPKIIAEELINQKDANPCELKGVDDSLMTYKFMCFNGIPKIMYITVKSGDIFEDYYDMDYQPIAIKRRYRNSGLNIPRPMTWEEMKRVASVLSANVPFLRVDLYEIKGEVKFSECTFYDWGGYCAFNEEWERRLGDWIQLPQKRKKIFYE